MPKSPLIHISTLLFDSPLAIQISKLTAILHAIGPRLNADQAALSSLIGERILPARPIRAYWDDDESDGYESTTSRRKEKPYAQTDAGVAIIPVRGVLMKKGGFMSALSGCTSYDGIGKSVTAAMDDPTVRAVLFDIDSPGGTTHGCFELSDLIHSYRGKKPTLAVANDLAASAAYAIASAADRVLLTRTAGVGSIGVFCLHLDQSDADAQAGHKYTYVYAGDHKVDGNPHEPISKSAKSSVQSEVDRQYNIFVQTVARNRSVKSASIISTQAEVLFEPAAIPLLADAVGTYDDALAELTSKVLGSSATISVSTNKQDMAAKTDNPIQITIETLRKNAADAAQAVTDAEAALASASASASTEPSEESVAAAIKTLATYQPARRIGKVGKLALTPLAAAADPSYMDDDASAVMDPDDETDPDEQCSNPDHPTGCTHGAAAATAESNAKVTNLMLDKTAALVPMPTPAPVPAPVPSTEAAATVAPTFTVEMATEIADLCAMVGKDNRSADFIRNKTPVAVVRKALIDARAEESASTAVNSSFGSVATDAFSAIIAQTDALVASSGGSLTSAAAMSKVIKSNPKLYAQYNQERTNASMTTQGTEQYIGRASALMSSLGLSSSPSVV